MAELIADLYDWVAAVGVAVGIYFIVSHHMKRAEARHRKQAQIDAERSLQTWRA